MTTNQERRAALSDAGLRVLAREGPRGLTHRAVDKEAGCPMGTTSNYHRSRDTLLSALADRIYERLAPSPDVLANPQAKPPSVAAFVEYVHDIVRRAQAAPELYLALLELRLEARRNPQLGPRLAATLHRGYCSDVEFHRAAQLPGGALEIALLRYAIDGLLLDRLGTSIGSAEPMDEAVRVLVTRLVSANGSPVEVLR